VLAGLVIRGLKSPNKRYTERKEEGKIMMSRLQRHGRLVHMDLFQYLISLLSHRIHCDHCMALICSIHINMQWGFQQTLHHFRYHARAQALPLARPFTDACTFPRRPQFFSPSRSSQTFAFACLTSISNRIISKRHLMGTLNLRNSVAVRTRHRNSESRCLAQTYWKMHQWWGSMH
jgi:hypothetical protein